MTVAMDGNAPHPNPNRGTFGETDTNYSGGTSAQFMIPAEQRVIAQGRRGSGAQGQRASGGSEISGGERDTLGI